MAANGETLTKTQDNPKVERKPNGNFFSPRVDIYETEKEFLLLAEIPGVRPENVDLQFERGELHLQALVNEVSQPTGKGVREFRVGNFQRAFQLPDTIDSSKIDAECRQGILTIHLPKLDAVQPKQVQIRGE